jgi:hypothetical protein
VIFFNAAISCVRWLSLSSFFNLSMIAGTALRESGPISPRDVTAKSPSINLLGTTGIKDGTALAAELPIFPRAKMAAQRTVSSASLNVLMSAGTAAFETSGPRSPRA